MPVGDQHHDGVAIAVAIGSRRLGMKAVDFGIGQVFPRPHLGIVYPLGLLAVQICWRVQPLARTPPSCRVTVSAR